MSLNILRGSSRGLISSLSRFYTSSVEGISKLTFQEVQEELKKPKTFLLDVREKDELITDGRIRQEAKNIPLGEIQGAIQLDEESFKRQYGFDKPKSDEALVVHCKAGVRAMKAAVSLTQAGFSNVKVYDGLLDWLSNGGSVVK